MPVDDSSPEVQAWLDRLVGELCLRWDSDSLRSAPADALLIDDLGFDSLDLAVLISTLEDLCPGLEWPPVEAFMSFRLLDFAWRLAEHTRHRGASGAVS